MVDLKLKEVFLIDLDDTLIDTSGASKIALRRAYGKLSSECNEDLATILSEDGFTKQMEEIYRNDKDENGHAFLDYDAEVFEIYCTRTLPKIGLTFRHTEHSLAARLFWQFKETKNSCLMGRENAFELINTLRKRGAVYCITQGRCNYQHTKAMLTDIEPRLNGISVVVPPKTKEDELPKYLVAKQFQAEKTVMIGDKPSDIRAGKKAEVDTIRIVYPRLGDDFSTNVPDLTYNNLGEFMQALKKACFI